MLGRVRALLLFLAFCAVVAVGQIGIQRFVLPPVLGFRPELFGAGRMWIEVGYLTANLIAIAIFWRTSKRPAEAFALHSARPARDVGFGVLAGSASVILATLAAMPFDGSWLRWSGAGVADLATTFSWMALFYLLVALVEESMFRGYALTQLGRAIGFYPGAILLSVLFVSWHVSRPDAAIDSFIEYALFAAIMVWSVRRSGALWFAVGMHWGWNVGNTWFLGVPDGLQRVPGTLLLAPFSDVKFHLADVLVDAVMTVILVIWLNRLYPTVAARWKGENPR